ncbi:MAG: hypothetical protein VYD41_00100 [Candidatus Thermoplasmatota archaeon]|nr:hypothetical protein [Candidatus Thermoplasmatota archaeon]
MVDEAGSIPGSDAPVEDKLIFLQANMVSFASQYNLPVIEVSLVVSKYLRILTQSLEEHAKLHRETIPEDLLLSRPLEAIPITPNLSDFPIETLLDKVDQDRMDILDTILRTTINKTELPVPHAISLLRDWEGIVRAQLSQATSPGHLFSPVELPDGF